MRTNEEYFPECSDCAHNTSLDGISCKFGDGIFLDADTGEIRCKYVDWKPMTPPLYSLLREMSERIANLEDKVKELETK